MILPLMGFVGKLKRFVSGTTSRNGFLLQIRGCEKPITYNLIFATKNFDNKDLFPKSDTMTLNFMVAVSALLAFTFSLINLLSHFHPQDHIISIITLLVLNGLIVPIFSYFFFSDAVYWTYGLITMFFDKNCREWHTCEHKSAVLIEAGLEPTVENLKKMPATLLSCGTSIYGTRIGASTLSIMLALSHSLIPSNILTIIAVLLPIPIISYICYGFILASKREKFRHCLITIIALPMIALPLITEKLFTLKEPSEEKYRKTAEELKHFIEFFQIY